MFYAFIENDKITGSGECKCLNENIYNFEISEEIYRNINRYMFDNGNIVLNPNYDDEQTEKLRTQKLNENIQKAKQAVEEGYIEFKDAQFETNAQTVGDLTATMLLMQASEMESYQWLSKDDQVVELTLEDFGTLGALIAGYKAHIWNEEYLNYKQQIEEAQTEAELNEITINY